MNPTHTKQRPFIPSTTRDSTTGFTPRQQAHHNYPFCLKRYPMSDSEFRVAGVMPNPAAPSYLPDAEFSPDGRYFAVTERHSHRVRLYRREDLSLVRSYDGEISGLDFPHGLALTNEFLLVSSKGSGPDAPTYISCFSLHSGDLSPVSITYTPRKDLREPHSLAVAQGHVFTTYCEGEANGLASFAFDEATGELGECKQFIHDCFVGYGEPKGVAVDQEHQRLIVSFVDEKYVPLASSNWREKLRRAWNMSSDPAHFVSKALRGIRTQFRSASDEPVRNGIMIFPLDSGRVEESPIDTIESGGYTRFENVDVRGDLLAIADPLNNTVALYRLRQGVLDEPLTSLSEPFTFPHDVAISPDGNTLLVANYGIICHEQEVMWECFTEHRTDNLVVLTRET